MLRSVLEVQRFRAISAQGKSCGWLKDIYFDDRTWEIKSLVLQLDVREFGGKKVLLEPADIDGFGDDNSLFLRPSCERAAQKPLAGSVLPVCRQYAALAAGSPRTRLGGRSAVADPYLRSACAVIHYVVNANGQPGGTLADIIFDDCAWKIRYLAIEQAVQSKKLRFHVLPQSVERFTWSTQRVLLHKLQPVVLAGAASSEIRESAA